MRRDALACLAAVAAIVAGVVLLSGGNDRPLSDDEYRKELVTAFADLRLDVDPTDGGAALRDFAEQFDDLAGRLEDMRPPTAAAAAHARLVSGLQEYADQLDSLAGSGREGAITFAQQLAETGGPGRAFVEAFNELATRGYLTYQPRETR
jgi:hypothetical protein